jgi:hypothetical protein
MRPGHYTELFFLDEATALAAGHRPCAECQRSRFNLFRENWAKANSDSTDAPRPAATLLDASLHQERLSRNSAYLSYETLPDGTFITFDEREAYLKIKDRVLRWTPAGYEIGSALKMNSPARILTPPSIVKTLRAGYPVAIHTSAFEKF